MPPCVQVIFESGMLRSGLQPYIRPLMQDDKPAGPVTLSAAKPPQNRARRVLDKTYKISGADDRADAAYHIKINHLNIISLLILCGGGGEIRTHERR